MGRAALCASALLAVAFVAGCGGARISTLSLTTRGPHPQGYLEVAIRFAGGPVMESRRLGGGKVGIYNGRRHFVGALHIEPGHRGRVMLRPGRYSLGLGHGPPTVKQLRGCRPGVAVVRAGVITHYALSYGCSIP